ncbi:hypothetical protein ACXIUS_01660 [Bosea thiooxidans]
MDQKPLWTSEHNPIYQRGQASELLSGHVIRYNPPAQKREDGSTSHGLNFPALAITAWVGDADKIAAQIARDLNTHPHLLAALKACCARLEYLGEDMETWTTDAQAAVAAAEAEAEAKPAEG